MVNKLNPYLTFGGNTKEAMTFYKVVFGGDLTLQTFKEMHAAQSSEQEDLIMHSQLITADGMTLMASDDPDGPGSEPSTVSVALSGEDEAVIRVYWDAS